MRHIADDLQARLDTLIEPFLNPANYLRQCQAHRELSLEDRCSPYLYVCLVPERLAHFYRQLYRVGAWPISSQVKRNGIAAVADSLLQYKNYVPPRNSRCKCFANVNIKMIIQEIVHGVEREPRHLCLKCVKAGIVSREQGNCGAKEKSACKLGKSGDDTAM